MQTVSLYVYIYIYTYMNIYIYMRVLLLNNAERIEQSLKPNEFFSDICGSITFG